MSKYRSITEVQSAIRSGEVSCEDIVRSYLQQIDEQADLNIYVEVYAEEAIEQARAQDRRLREDPESLGRLFGVVVSLKDVLCHQDHGVTAGSKILTGFRSLFSATAVERLLAEDAIVIGRVNCDEFAMGSTNETSIYGPTRNAAHPDYIPGGSSGASAVSVQAGTCLVSLGTDTGGSVRQPAAFCGILGFKPTYGRISRHGLLAYGSSFDQVGILAHSVSDIAILLEIMAGPDEYDSTAVREEAPAYSEQLTFDGPARIAYFPAALEHDSVDPEVRQACRRMLDDWQAQGHEVAAVDFPYLDYLVPAYYVLTTAEASSNLARYDGVRYGYRSPEAENLIDTYQRSRTEGFGTEVKRRIMLGTFVLSSGYYDAYYTKAQQVRRLIRESTLEILRQYDFIFLPAAPSTAWKLGETVEDPVAMYLSDIFTVQANMAGIPAIAFPAATHSNGLPIGVQLMADRLAEAKLLSFVRETLETEGL